MGTGGPSQTVFSVLSRLFNPPQYLLVRRLQRFRRAAAGLRSVFDIDREGVAESVFLLFPLNFLTRPQFPHRHEL